MTMSRRIVRIALISSAALLAGAVTLSAGCTCKGCPTGGAACTIQKAWPSNDRDGLVPTFFGSTTGNTTRVSTSGN